MEIAWKIKETGPGTTGGSIFWLLGITSGPVIRFRVLILHRRSISAVEKGGPGER